MEQFDVAVVGLGALGSAAAYHLARRGSRVVAFEQFELGHVRGASHDTSRIVRTSYGSAAYVRFAQAAYREWAALEAATGERLLTVTGGVVFIPDDGPYDAADFARSLSASGVPFEMLGPAEVRARWPQFAVPEGVTCVYTPDSGIAHAARTVATLQMHARVLGATLRDRTRVDRLRPDGEGVIVSTSGGDVRARRVVVAADAWTNELLEPLGIRIPLEVMQEQVSYFAPADPEAFDRDRFPVWIWEDEQCFYGFPTYGEPTIKAARDVSENRMTPAERTFVPSPERAAELTAFLAATIPTSGPLLRTVTCQYALTPGRRFVIGPLTEHPDIVVALGAGHAFKFTPAIGLALAELARGEDTTDDLTAFALDATAVPAM
ncbi:sarcosine oxidase [Microbacterium sp. ru370.1]|uniref:N-methyl-L-tryptophan oxidase n=1 Tax=unclassified Microbacterium TaxID=2609290 RepID=UPI00088B52BF|nr:MULTISPECIES: N-methyl-L-tryptophan oxidase [unclassified Microbacterium]SDO25931.1 sarcosine oxidase [Microbacterium sp. ru370.1]SIT73975.1 sarcosine oxidase [Microbacterium sp. RU1D]